MIKVEIHKSDEMGNVYTLLEPIVLKDYGITVPRGFNSDGASVPRFFWRVVFPPGDSKALRAAFVHDWLYRNHFTGWDREMADVLFFSLLISDGVSLFSAGLAFLGVRLFGWRSWK